ncbi:MAG TPA: SDR family NAD(P)-dependent oxidoreductase, partial [Euzebya sp.]|nr:SDR family NAD(P)-dependent oxidoreductase [Euzebya sp.]
MQLSGTVGLVTGGASGLGRATAEMLLARGARVVVVDLPSSSGAEVAAGMGEAAVFVPTDVTDGDAVAEAVATATGLGDLRVVVNCAGVATPGRVVSRQGPMPLDQFEFVVRVNLIGTFNVIRLGAAAMAETEPVDGERGVIINTASVAAFDGQIGQAAYAAS